MNNIIDITKKLENKKKLEDEDLMWIADAILSGSVTEIVGVVKSGDKYLPLLPPNRDRLTVAEFEDIMSEYIDKIEFEKD